VSRDRCTFPDVGADSRTTTWFAACSARVERAWNHIPLGTHHDAPASFRRHGRHHPRQPLVFVLELQAVSPRDPVSAIPPTSSGHHWITLVTAMFMHASWSHIIGNMVFLWAFGPEIEDAMGPRRYVVFYLVGAWSHAGQVASPCFHGS